MIRILLADDHPIMREGLRAVLETQPDFEIVGTLEQAANGEEALRLALELKPDILLLDLEMPVMDGYEAAKRLREMERAEGRARCTIVAISSNDDQAIVQRALAAGCDHYLTKPAERTALLQLLKK